MARKERYRLTMRLMVTSSKGPTSAPCHAGGKAVTPPTTDRPVRYGCGACGMSSYTAQNTDALAR